MKIVRINKDGTMNDIEYKNKKGIVLKQLEKLAVSKGCSEFCELYNWSYDCKDIKCYGWYDGEPGFENKHDLIPNGKSSFLDENSSEKLLFGDLFFICYNGKKIVDYLVSDYAELYNVLFEGFDDCSSQEDYNDSESGEDNISDNDSINSFIEDDISENSDDSYSCDYSDELDEDNNIYD